MNIKINGEESVLDSKITLNEFITKRLNGKEPRGIAVALNMTIIPKSKWDETVINENDEIEIVTAVQGG
ncbi:MAG: sulfur carrier protein ThiS [Ignavibacteriae bacterium]|nr:MAG: sulfur carrier protein ThiS [Ignavibacteriota bacterium]